MTNSRILLPDNVSRVHGEGETAVRALDGVTLTVHAGELVAVMGPSGSGKSTLLNLAGGLDQPTSGRVVIEGSDVGAMSLRDLAALRRRSLGFVFQDFNLIPSLTAAENVALPLELDGERARKARRVALDSLETVGNPPSLPIATPSACREASSNAWPSLAPASVGACRLPVSPSCSSAGSRSPGA